MEKMEKTDLTNMEFSIRLDIARARDDMDEIKKLIEQILYILNKSGLSGSN